MNSRVDETLLRQAIAEHILPSDAGVMPEPTLPWPISVLAVLGGWLAIVPLCVWLFLTVPGMLKHAMVGAGIGAAVLLPSVWIVSRFKHQPLAVLAAMPALFGGELIIGASLCITQPVDVALAVMALVALGCAWGCAHHFLRILMGVQTAVLILLSFGWPTYHQEGYSRWAILHMQLAVWGGLQVFLRSVFTSPSAVKHAALAEALGAGWIWAVIAGLTLAARPDWLLQLSTDEALTAILYGTGSFQHGAAGESLVSLLIAAGAVLWVRAKWASMRSLPAMLACCTVLVLAWFIPTLGGLVMILAVSALSARWRTAALASLACVLTLVSFYHGLGWLLAVKAVLLIALGGTLLVAAVRDLRREAVPAAVLPLLAPQPGERRTWLRPPVLMPLAGAILMLTLVNWQIWQQEDVLARGRSVYFEIGPVDPRSLMQGDYMELTFPVLGAVDRDCRRLTVCPVVAKLDGRGVVVAARKHSERPLAADELLLHLAVRSGRTKPGASEWFFAEGEGPRWAKARYAHFRLLPDGRSALSELRGAQMEKL